MPKMTGLAVAALMALAVGESMADEAKGPDCGAFTLVGGEKGVEVVDNPPAGRSSGDTRAGWRKLADESGNPVGEVQFVATLTAPGGGDRGDVLAADYFVTLPDGWIASTSVYELANAADTSQRAGNATLVVTGGTGAYRGASGTIVIEPGEAPRYVFDLACN
jgi:hypothetical protein